LTDRQHSVTRVFDVINATKKATRGTVIESSESVITSVRLMVLFRSREGRPGCM
jgi:alkyl hydroperoxide reductase subunit AhpC